MSKNFLEELAASCNQEVFVLEVEGILLLFEESAAVSVGLGDGLCALECEPGALSHVGFVPGSPLFRSLTLLLCAPATRQEHTHVSVSEHCWPSVTR